MKNTKVFTVHVRATWRETKEGREHVTLGKPLLLVEPGHRKRVIGDDGSDERSEMIGVVELEEHELSAFENPRAILEAGVIWLRSEKDGSVARIREARISDAPQPVAEPALESVVNRSDVVVRDPHKWRAIRVNGEIIKFSHELFGESFGPVITNGTIAYMIDAEDHAKLVHLDALTQITKVSGKTVAGPRADKLPKEGKVREGKNSINAELIAQLNVDF